MEMTDLISFELLENAISTPKGNFYLFRILPPNFSTLDNNDKEKLYSQFEQLMRTVTDIPFNIFVMDKTLNLNLNREYISSLDSRFEEMKKDILNDLNSVESTIGNTERSYYIIINPKKSAVVEQFQSVLRSTGFNFHLAERDELITVMRCFLRREFIDEDIYIGEDDNLET